jgi:hypothetical protein
MEAKVIYFGDGRDWGADRLDDDADLEELLRRWVLEERRDVAVIESNLPVNGDGGEPYLRVQVSASGAEPVCERRDGFVRFYRDKNGSPYDPGEVILVPKVLGKRIREILTELEEELG